MRVLLIDNHDSFTYNLAHDIAVVNSRWPTVLLNDDPQCRPADVDWLHRFDAVVVSPGPGSPLQREDLGHSAAVVAQGEVPVLGVCLGHQAIGHAYGGSVGRAPLPVHGQVALVRHDRRGLFRGMTSPLEMVRYHSLVVDALGPELVADAWCDSLIMALHHPRRPLWGVQTHPESISTSGGRRLMANFMDLAQEWNDGHRRISRPPAAKTKPQSEPAAPTPRLSPKNLVLHADRTSFTGADDSAFAQLFLHEDHPWWLDSNQAGGQIGRFSYMGSAAGPLSRVLTAGNDGFLRVRGAGIERVEKGDLFDFLRRDLEHRPRGMPLPFDFTLGWVGYLSYEFGSERLIGRGHAAPSPVAVLVFADRCVVIDHKNHEAWALALGTESHDPRPWISDTLDRLNSIGSPASSVAPAIAGPVGDADANIELRHAKDDYLHLVDRCLEHIATGETYELCLTNQIVVHTKAEPWATYRRLRCTSPRPFGAYLAFGSRHLLSASPERLLKVSVDGGLESKPIKGTRRRNLDPIEDARLGQELVNNPKDRAENLMIVDLVRNDLGRVSAPGSVAVPKLFGLESFSGVHQLVSTVRGKLRDECTAVDALQAVFPGGSMTGAPKERSIALLRQLECGPRGIYSGAAGYLSLSGAADWSIVIRSIVWEPDRLTYGTGGAIIALSEPEAEWDEILVKAGTLGSVLGIDFGGILRGLGSVHEGRRM